MTTLSRPRSVTIGIYLLYTALIIGVVMNVIWLLAYAPTMTPPGMRVSTLSITGIVIFLLFFLLGWYFIYEIGRGKNWARILLLTFYILGALLSLLSWLKSNMSFSVFIITVHSLTLLLGLVAFIYLFTKEAGEWFQSAGR
ncbi:MAG: hypothetical protein A3F41_04995 [Coxiella sp. RIFCSPHIGHO2_12_FULL_44_14]|nr:MAG: hypothetical protein A3F41_04995 [Coxiella sp. RIFCSPHIGHO2_12_FULL_44_14]